MSDMTSAIIAKSDQLNADDLMGGPITIEITGISISSSAEQKVSLSYKGDQGKPYKPCKSMCRVIVNGWGADGNKYAGRRLTLYRDPNVTWAGMKVGGIRISHMSHITEESSMALTASKGNKKLYTVKPLAAEPILSQPVSLDVLKKDGEAAAAKGTDALRDWWQSIGAPNQKRVGEETLSALKTKAASSAKIELPDDGFSDNEGSAV